jgi:20S proteasome subunit alpha 5
MVVFFVGLVVFVAAVVVEFSVFAMQSHGSQATKLSLEVLKQVMEEKLNSTNVEVASVTAEHGYHVLTKEEVEAVVASLD